MSFDPIQYKTTTRCQWEDAAEAWHRWGPTLETWLGEATETMLDAVDMTAGCTVLDVAAGAGGQTLAAARRVGRTEGSSPPTSRRRSSPMPRRRPQRPD